MAAAVPKARDPFTDPQIDTRKWEVIEKEGTKWRVRAEKLNFSAAPGIKGGAYSALNFNGQRPLNTEDWEVTVDVTNKSKLGDLTGIGLVIFNPADQGDQVSMELCGRGTGAGFTMASFLNGKSGSTTEVSRNLGVESGSLKISFDSKKQLLTFRYDRNGPEGGYKWTKLTTFRVDKTTGAGGNWKMKKGDEFGIVLFAYTTGKAVPLGKMTLDNFRMRNLK